MFLSVMDL